MILRKRLSIGLAGLVIVGLLGFLVLAWRPAITPIAPPAAASFPREMVARGEALAGGYPMPTPFGVIYSTNITPDPETGIGVWSEAAFARAMREGIARDGSHLFPAFPFDHFTKVSDDDVNTLYAYFMTRPPIRAM